MEENIPRSAPITDYEKLTKALEIYSSNSSSEIYMNNNKEIYFNIKILYYI